MTGETKEKKIVITVKDDDYLHPEIELTGTFNGSQMRRTLASVGKYIRVQATKAHYERQYAEEKRKQDKIDAADEERRLREVEEERLANEKLAEDEELIDARLAEGAKDELDEHETIDDICLGEDESDEDNTNMDNGINESTEDNDLPEKDDEENEKDDDDLSYLSDGDNTNKEE